MHPRPRARSRAPSASDRSLLRPLGIVGYDALEPVLLAALATREPLLLVSDHGAAKTLLLVRLADALGLELRHYNASLLQFDDLAGFPIPDEHGGIRYAAGPGAIWGAQVAFFDEIGRCRPEVANKLFPLVHERRLQGVRLERLEHRWAATNPPPDAQAPDPDSIYDAVERLDPALADRFAYVVRLPRFADLADADRAAIVRGAGESVEPDAHAAVQALVAAARDLLAPTRAHLGDAATAYVLALGPHLAAAGLAHGGRRAATLHRNLVAVAAACLALGRPAGEAAFLAALECSIPDVVRRHVPHAVIVAAHRRAWEQATLPDADPVRVFRAVGDPLRRAALALSLPGLAETFRGEALASALAELPQWRREIVAWHLLPHVQRERLVPPPAVETVAELVEGIAQGEHVIRAGTGQLAWIPKAEAALRDQQLEPFAVHYLVNVLVTAAKRSQAEGGLPMTGWEANVEAVLAAWREAAAALPARAREAA